MRQLLLLSIGLGCWLLACSPTPEKTPTSAAPAAFSIPPGYDSLLAKELGADEYGMKLYVMAFLKRGPNRDLPETEAAELQKAHMANIGRMAEMGKLVLAGPFGGDGDIRGIYIFDVETVEEAEQLTASDPAVKAGSLVMELHPWYGSAALKLVNPLHEKVTKTNI